MTIKVGQSFKKGGEEKTMEMNVKEYIQKDYNDLSSEEIEALLNYIHYRPLWMSLRGSDDPDFDFSTATVIGREDDRDIYRSAIGEILKVKRYKDEADWYYSERLSFYKDPDKFIVNPESFESCIRPVVLKRIKVQEELEAQIKSYWAGIPVKEKAETIFSELLMILAKKLEENKSQELIHLDNDIFRIKDDIQRIKTELDWAGISEWYKNT